MKIHRLAAACRRVLFAFAIVLLAVTRASAANVEVRYQLLLDTDNDASSGCSVTVNGALFRGAEQLVTTTVVVANETASVTGVQQRRCINPATNTFAAPIAIDSATWPVGLNASSGNMLVETHLPLNAIANRARSMRIGFSISTDAASTAVFANPDGSPSLCPPASQGRRRAVGHPGDPWPVIHLDGNGDDWLGIAPLSLASSAADSTTLRFIKVYASIDDSQLYFRFDAHVDARTLLAVDDTYVGLQGHALSVPAPGVLANDVDPLGGTLSADVTAPATHGTLSLNADGGFTYMHDGGAAPEDSFRYKANNGVTESNEATVTLNLVPNSVPQTGADAYTVAHGGTLSIPAPGVLANDSDGDDDPLSAFVSTPPAHGTLTLAADGGFVYHHDGSNTLSDSFFYTVTDGVVSSNPVSVAITIGADAAPVATADAYSLAEGGTIDTPSGATSLWTNDSDADTPQSQWTTTIVTPPAHASTFTLKTGGNFTYVHDGSETASDTFVYTISDGIVTSAPVTATINVTPVNDAPVAVLDNFSTTEDQSITTTALTGVLANDTDVDTAHASLQAAVVVNVQHGTLTLNGDGSFTYQPAVNYNGNDTFTYRANDGVADSNVVTVAITIAAVNDAPTITGPTAASVNEDSPLAFAGANEFTIADPDLGSNNATVTIAATNGVVTLGSTTGLTVSGNGTALLTASGTSTNLNAALATLTFIATPNYNGAATVQLTVSDQGNSGSGGALTANALTNITVVAINDAPSATAGATLAYSENQAPTAIDTTVTVADVDNTTLATATVQITSNYASGQDLLSFANTANITATFNAATGTLTLTGSDTHANWQAALRAVSYANTSDNPSAATRTITWIVSDGSASSAPVTSTITMTPANDAPTATAGSTLNYTENQGEAAIDATITLADADNSSLSAATVQITSNYANGEDLLSFANTAAITGSFNAATGTLTLTGAAPLSAWQSALRSVTYANVSDDPSAAPRTVSWIVNDGALASSGVTSTINVVPADDAPVVTAGATLVYVENGAASAIDSTVTISDVDDATAASATVQITGNYQNGEDLLSFADTAEITASFDAASGTLTLTGVTTLANWQTALRSVRYQNLSDHPLTTGRTVTWIVNDGTIGSTPVTSAINITALNDAPLVTAGATLSYTENQAAVAIDATVTISDADDSNLSSATVQISGNLATAEDVLAFANTATITGSYNAGSGTLTLSGSDTIANWQAALRSVTYANTSDDPSSASRTITWTVNDGTNASSGVTSTITIAPANDVPSVQPSSNLSYTEAQGAAILDAGVTVADADDTNLAGAAVQISGNYASGEDVLAFSTIGPISGSFNAATGTLTLSGTDTLANYQAALRTITYTNTSSHPSTLVRTLTWNATDPAAGTGAGLTSTIAITAINNAPTMTAGGALGYTENQAATAIDATITIGDVDNAMLASGSAQITGNYVSGEDVLSFAATANITSSFNATTGTLTLTGADTVANWQAAFAAIQYANTSDDPSVATRTVTWTVSDGALSAAAVTSTITVTPVNDAPTVTPTTDLAYTEGDGSVLIDPDLGASDPDDTQFTGATVQITGNYASGEDVLAFANTASITGSFNTVTGTLTLTGTDTIDHYRTALESVTYTNTSNAPSPLPRTVHWNATDPAGGTGANLTSTITVASTNTAPSVTTSNTLSYSENAAPQAIEPSLSVTDPDSTMLAGATITITSGLQSSADVLSFTTNGTINGSYNAATGVLALSGTDTVANYQSVLRTVRYANTSDDPSIASRTVTWVVTDGTDNSSPASTTINVAAVNDAPSVTVAASASYTEDAAPVVLASAMTITDPDNTTITGASVAITANFVSPQDVLAATGAGNVTVSYNSATGVLTLSGTDTLGVYQSVLRTVSYSNSSQNPSALARTLTWSVNDGTNSGTASSIITIVNVNDAPVVTVVTSTTAFTENDAATTIGTGLTITDADHANLSGATVAITANYQNGADALAIPCLACTGGAGMSALWNPATATLTISGTGTVAEYQATLRSITFLNTSDTPSTAPRTISWSATDGTAASNTATSTINVTAVNDAPVVSNAGSASYVEDSAPVTLTSTIIVSDVDSNIASATVQITGNFAAAEDLLSFATIGAISGSYNGATGVLTLTGAGTPAQYQAALRSVTYANSSQNPSTATRTITWNVHDGSVSSSGTTSSLSVANVNDAPIVTAGSTLAYTENDPATIIAGTVTVTDVDSGNLTAATVSISAGFQNGADLLAFVNQNGISGSYNSGTGVLALSGASSVANYQTALRSITYRNTSDAPTATRTISWVVTDGSTPSGTVTSSINITAVNDAPALTAGATLSFTENQGASPIDTTITVADVDSTNLTTATVQLTGNYQNGQDVLAFANTAQITAGAFNSATGTLTLTGTTTLANWQAALRAVTYNNTSENPITTARTVTWTISDGIANSNAATSTIAVIAVNDAPVVTAGGTLTYTENDAATVIDASIAITDVDSGDLTGATVSITSGFQSGADVLSFATFGAITGSYNAATGVLTLTGTALVSNYQSALRTVKYSNSSDAPSTTARTIGFVVNDGTANSSAATSTVNVTAVNDAPANTLPATVNVDEDTDHVFSGTLSVADVDASTNTIDVTLSATNGKITLSGLTGLTVQSGANGTSSLTVRGTIANLNAALNGAKYRGNQDYFGSDTISITTNDRGFTGTPGAQQDIDTIAVTVNPVNDAPVATAKTHATHSAIGLTITAASHTGELKEGATDVDDATGELTVQLVAGTISPASMQVTLLSASDGSFYVEPPGGFTGAATFQFKVCDDNAGDPNQCSAATTATINVGGVETWFIDDTDAAGCGVTCNGARNKPLVGLNNANAAFAARGTGDSIFAFAGTYNHGFTLAANERLVGQGSTAIQSALNHNYAAYTNGTLDSLPASGTAPTLQNTITAATGSYLRGVSISSGANKGYVASGATGLTVSESSIVSSNTAVDATGALSSSVSLFSTSSTGGARGISLDNISGTWAFGTGSLTGNTAAGFYLQNANSSTITSGATIAPAAGGRAVLIGTANGNSAVNASNGLEAGSSVSFSGFMNAGGIAVYESTGGTLSFTNTVVASTGAVNAVELIDNDGATINFTTAGVILLSLTTSTGKGFVATQGGTVNVTGPNNTISSSGGRALEIAGASGSNMAGTLNWKTINANGGDRGITVSYFRGSLTVNGTGTAGTGGTIQNITARGGEFIDVSNGAATAISLQNMNFTSASTTDLGDTTSPTYTTGTCGTIASGGSNTGCSAAIHFDTVSGIVVSGVNISGTTTQNGINGYMLTDLALTNVDIGSVGDESNEDAINLQDVGGTITLTNLNSHNNRNRNFSIVQKTKTATLTATGSKFNNSTNEQGLIMEVVAAAASLTATYTTCEFKNNLSYGLNGTLAIAGGTLTVTVTGSTLTGNTAAGGMLLQGGGGTLNYTITNNTIHSNNISIALAASTNGVIGGTTGIISGNTLGLNGTPDSCSASGSTCINMEASNNGILRANVSGNTLYGVGTYGIRMAGRNTTKTFLTATGNTVSQPDAGSVAGIFVETGFPSGSSTCTQITLGGAGALKNTVTGAFAASIWLDDTASGVTNLTGYPGGSVTTYVEANNTIVANSGVYGGTFVNGTCP